MPIRLCLKHLSYKKLKDFCQQNNLQYNQEDGYVRLKYESVEGKTIFSEFYRLEEVESKVKQYMDEAVRSRKGSC